MKSPRPNGRPPRAPEHCRVTWRPRVGWRFQPTLRVDGKRLHGAWGSREDAIEERDQMLARRRAGEGETFCTLEEACQVVLDATPNAGTWRSYEEHFLTLAEFFGADAPLQAITAKRIEDFIRHRRSQRIRGKAPTDDRIRKNLVALGRVIRLATKRGRFAGANPLLNVEVPRATRKEAGHYSNEELHDVLSAMARLKTKTARRAFAIVCALSFSGLRRSELARLQRRQIDFHAGFLRDVVGKTGIRQVPISKPLNHALQVLATGLGDDDHIIPAGPARKPRKEGREPRPDIERRVGVIDATFRRCRAHLRSTLQGRFHPHTLRHWTRTALVDASVPRHVADKITGHATPGVGARYEHTNQAGMRMHATKALDPFEAMLTAVAEQHAVAQ